MQHSRQRKWHCRCYATLALILASQPAFSAPTLLEIARMDGAAWSIKGFKLRAELADPVTPALMLEIDSLVLPGAGSIERLLIKCHTVALTSRDLKCADGRYRFDYAEKKYQGDVALRYMARQRRVVVSVPGASSNAGALEFALSFGTQQTRLTLTGDEVALAPYSPLLKALAPVLADFDLDAGSVDLKFEFTRRLNQASQQTVKLDATFHDLTFANRSGRIAGEKVGATYNLAAQSLAKEDQWQGTSTLKLLRGGLYAEPVYLDLERYPLRAEGKFDFDADSLALNLPRFEIAQDGVVQMSGNLIGDEDERLKALHVDVQEVMFPSAYDTWLAGVLVGTPFAQLDTAGSARGHFAMKDGELSALNVEFDTLNIEDRQARFALYDLAAEINWVSDAAEISGSWISISGGFIYNAGVDATRLELGIAGQAIDLLEPARIPLLGGALAINTFTLRDYGSDELSLGLEANLEPIDLGQLTVALNWPAFTGKLSGRLPLLRYHGGEITVGGTLEAKAFDGDVYIERLRIQQPFGIVPKLSANIRLRNLDLEQVTEVVPFGRVSGRLDGDIDDLRLLKSEPVGFNARFRTPENDDSRHRLSQRAVDTISRVAGGGAVLSSTFLRIFKHFAYDKLGISCRLENDICHMDGVAPADQGYYIVKGALVPRVDLIGRVRQVQWSRLMSQLKLALNEGNITVE